MNADTPYRRQDDLLETEVDGEAVILNIATGRYYALDDVASRIWKMLEQPLTPAEVVEELTGQFDVAPEQCAADVGRFLRQMEESGVLVKHNGESA